MINFNFDFQFFIFDLEQRRQTGDIIQVFRILNGFDKVKWNDNQTLVARLTSEVNTRGHNKRLDKGQTSNCVQRENSFTNRVVPLELTTSVNVECKTIN